MIKINENFLKLEQSYLFSTIAKKVAAFQKENPDKKVIKLGIGDVTRPLPSVVIEAMKKAAEEQGSAETFRGYGPEQGYDFLREKIQKQDYFDRGIAIDIDEIFVSDGAKCDTGNIVDLFAEDNMVAITDPVYPVYRDTNLMSGRKKLSICHLQQKIILIQISQMKCQILFTYVIPIIQQELQWIVKK